MSNSEFENLSAKKRKSNVDKCKVHLPIQTILLAKHYSYLFFQQLQNYVDQGSISSTVLPIAFTLADPKSVKDTLMT